MVTGVVPFLPSIISIVFMFIVQSVYHSHQWSVAPVLDTYMKRLWGTSRTGEVEHTETWHGGLGLQGCGTRRRHSVVNAREYCFLICGPRGIRETLNILITTGMLDTTGGLIDTATYAERQ